MSNVRWRQYNGELRNYALAAGGFFLYVREKDGRRYTKNLSRSGQSKCWIIKSNCETEHIEK